MKKTALAFILLFIFTSISAQNNFEGKIVYKLTSPEKTGNAILETWFGKQKIRVYTKEIEIGGKEDLLLDFENNVVYYINTNSKVYKKDSITNQRRAMPPLSLYPAGNKMISGHNCSAFAMADTTKNDFMGDMLFNIWYADSLQYNISDEQKDYEMVPMFTNGKSIGLGMEIRMGKGKTIMNLAPLSITPQPVPDSVFVIPMGYTTQNDHDLDESIKAESDSASQAAVDSVAEVINAVVDSINKANQKKSTRSSKMNSKKQPSKSTSKKPIKSPATKPKD